MKQESEIYKNSSQSLKSGKFQKLVILAFIVLISLTLFHCANMQRPTGGPKDSLPPKLLNESPINLTTNFKASEIILTFDEFIKLNNQFKEFSISPDVEKQPEYRVRKKNLHIKLPDTLENNTTYTINFGKGLVDYNESNPIINYTYVFATGPELDSLTISGSVKNAFTKTFDEKVDKDVRVLLIPTRQDSIFGKKKASIFTSVDTSGNFTFKNLREDTYRIYALQEQNNDRIYNSPDEAIGFLKDSIILTTDISGIHLEYSKGKPLRHRTLEKKIEKDSRILLTFNQQLDDPDLQIFDPSTYNAAKVVNYSNYKDSAFVFLENLDFDSLKLQLSDNENIIDTILIRRGKNDKYERFITPLLNISNKVDKINHITLSSKFPLASIDKNKIQLLEDSVSRRNFQLQQDSLNSNLYHIRFNWRANKNYELVLEEKAMLSPFDDFNKEHKTKFTLDETDNYGDIIFQITGLDTSSNYIVELIDEAKTKVFNKRIIRNQSTLNYSKFPGGKYSIRIIQDINGNNKWDGANVYTLEQAEPIWYLNKTFTIRANWEQNETIAVKFE